MIDDVTIQTAKAVDIHKILEEYDWKTDSTGTFILCPSPDHDDTNPSVSINKKNNTCRCFSCKSTWDTIGLYQNLAKKVNGRMVAFPKAVKEVLEIDGNVTVPNMVGTIQSVPKVQKSGQSPYDTVKSNSRSMTGYELNYLHQRGIMLYDSYVYQGKVHTILTVDKALQTEADPQKVQELNEIKNRGTFYCGIAPILKANRIQIKHNYWQGVNSIIYLVDYEYDDDENLQQYALFLEDTERHMIIKKTLDANHQKQALGTSDFCWVAEGMGDKKSGEVFVCEGLEDALSYTMNGKRSISLNSISNLKSFMDYLKQDYRPANKQKFVISFDHDKAGEDAAKELIQFFKDYNLQHSNRHYEYGVCQYPQQFHDINDYWKSKVFQ